MYLFLFILGLILLIDLEDLRPYRDGRWHFLLRILLPPLPNEPPEHLEEETAEEQQLPIHPITKSYGQRVDTFKTPQQEELVDGIKTLAWEITPEGKKNNPKQSKQ